MGDRGEGDRGEGGIGGCWCHWMTGEGRFLGFSDQLITNSQYIKQHAMSTEDAKCLYYQITNQNLCVGE